MEAASLAVLAAFIGITNQTLARPGQICSLNRCHLTMNPNAELPVLPAFGPVMMLHLGDRGHHKVVDKGTDMTHFVMRTLHPSLDNTVYAPGLLWPSTQPFKQRCKGGAVMMKYAKG